MFAGFLGGVVGGEVFCSVAKQAETESDVDLVDVLRDRDAHVAEAGVVAGLGFDVGCDRLGEGSDREGGEFQGGGGHDGGRDMVEELRRPEVGGRGGDRPEA